MGPLQGVKIVEIAGIGSEPFAGMMLADMGAEMIRVDRREMAVEIIDPKFEVLNRSRRSVIIDLKKPEGIETVLRFVDQADALIEGFRAGVMERLGLGPDICIARNPKLVYGRITGWGQDGPMARVAGHDINYIAITGALNSIGNKNGKPVPPLNLLGDFGGGGLLLAFGMACALFEAQKSGKGQVVDAAMVDGVSVIMAMNHGLRASGFWSDQRGENMVDSGAHFYDTYETSDGKYVSIGSIEPQFYALLLEKLEISDPEFGDQLNPEKWSALKERVAERFKTKTRDEWCEIMEGTDVCFAPVLTLPEAYKYPHNVERNTFVEIEGITHPAPAPRFSRTVPEIQGPPAIPGAHTEEILKDWGFSPEEIQELRQLEAI